MMRDTKGTAGMTAEASAQLHLLSESAVLTESDASKVLSSAQVLTSQSNLLRDEARRFIASVRTGALISAS